MDSLYNYGISQEDVLTERRALDIRSGDSLLCIASAGEIPLNLAALEDIRIVAVDHSENQLRLCRIKKAAALAMESIEAAGFLGYMKMTPDERIRLYQKGIRSVLSPEDALFWDHQQETIRAGVINAARFERYILKVAAIGRMIIGRGNLYRLFDCDTVEEQKALFDRRITGPLVKGIFKVAFHPKIYKNRGIDPTGLTHSGARNIADFFHLRFRNFCCSTPARQNYYLQYTFFGRVLFPEALPEFLQPHSRAKFANNAARMEFRLSDFGGALKSAGKGAFNKIHLSNVGDWLSKEAMAELFALVRDVTNPGDRAVMRYIHYHHRIPENVPELEADYESGADLSLTDRYPFYTIVPIKRN
jgi:S-adenosylmethionine-diacylglycerol 3-amino-3-carboxypropyl transferase